MTAAKIHTGTVSLLTCIYKPLNFNARGFHTPTNKTWNFDVSQGLQLMSERVDDRRNTNRPTAIPGVSHQVDSSTAPWLKARSQNEFMNSTSFQASHNDLENLNQTLKQVALQQVVPKELHVFSNDPKEWPKFILPYARPTQRCEENLMAKREVDQDYQCVLWRYGDDTREPDVFVMKVMTFGAS